MAAESSHAASGTRPLGVSIVICCHNSATRLPPTLDHLARQEGTEGLAWEVLVIDNASSDGTAEVARKLWPAEAPAPLRVIPEPALGLTPARLRGIAESRYELISFVDDDNWVCPEWVRTVVEVMAARPDVAACGGRNDAVCEVEPPPWFEWAQLYYAVGSHGDEAREVTDSLLVGAGLNLRFRAWEQITRAGFRFSLSDRKGNSLASGGDSELVLALRVAGWRLWFDPRLRLKHYMPKGRLDWDYFRRLMRGGGKSTLGLDPYYREFQQLGTARERLRRRWQYQALRAVRELLRRPLKGLLPSVFLPAGDPDAAVIEAHRARLAELLRERGRYDARFREFDAKRWSDAGPAARDVSR